MSLTRKYALTEYDGEKKPFKTIADRRALIGKRVGYDYSFSCLSHVGRVRGTTRQELLFEDGTSVSVNSLQQVVVLNDQTNGGKWKK